MQKRTLEAKDDNLCVFLKLDSNDEVTAAFSDDLGQTFVNFLSTKYGGYIPD